MRKELSALLLAVPWLAYAQSHDAHMPQAATQATSLGVDNLTNDKYFIGPHPFQQRTWHAELRLDY